MPMRVAIAGRQISEMVSHWWCIPGREHEFYVGFWRRKGKKSKRGSKRRRRVWFSNIVETICPSESSKGKHSCSDEKNTSSEDDSELANLPGSNEDGLDTLVAMDIVSGCLTCKYEWMVNAQEAIV
ncbi:hypothetical protein ACQJBY_011326 [Aegilops geniculata]